MSLCFYKSNPLSLLGIFFGLVSLCFVLFFAWPHIAFAVHIPTITLDDPPSLLDCSGATSQVHLSWSSDMHGGASYFVERRLQGDPSYIDIAGPLVVLSYIDATAGSGNTYEYRIRGERAGDPNVLSAVIIVTAEYCASVLAAPIPNCATDGPHISLNWTAISGNLNTYEIYRDGVKIGDTTSTSFDDNLNVQGTISYNYFIRAIWQDATQRDSNTPPAVEALACPVVLSRASQCLIVSPGGPSINLSWNSLLGVQEYQVYRQAPGDASHTLLQGGLSATSFADNLVDSLSTDYFQSGTISYYVKAIWPNSDQSDSTFQQIIIPQCAPLLSVTTNCLNKEFQLSWTGTQGASHYNVIRDGSFISPQVNQPTLIFNDGTPDIATRTYRVDAIVGPPLSSNEVTASIDCTIIQPPSPDPILSQPIAMCSAGDSQISLSWTPSNNVNNYTVYRSDPLNSAQGIWNPTTAFYTDPGVNSGIDYTYYIIAFGLGGTQSNPSNALTETAVSCVAPTQPVLNVSDQCATGDPEVTISWTSDDTNTLQYVVLRSNDGGATFPVTVGIVDVNDPKTVLDPSVAPSTTYHYKVVAEGPFGVPSVDSNIDSALTSACLPTTPTNLTLQNTCVSGAPRVDVSWTTNHANTVRYEVFRGSFESPPLGVPITSWQDNGVVASTLYTYRVDAVGPTGARSSSSNQSITTSDCSVPGPFTLNLDQAPQCVGSYLRADLSWGVSSNATSYDLHQSRVSPAQTTTYSNVTSSFVDIGLGNALDFDGGNDYVRIGDELDPGSSLMTISVWFQWGGKTSDNIIYNKENLYEARVRNGFFQYAWKPHWNWDGGTSFPVVAGQWYHATVVYDKTNQYLYKNGQLVFQRTQSGDIGSNSSPLYFGRRSSGHYFDGLIDEVRVYNRALGSTEIAEHFAGIYSDETDLVGLWHFDEGSGQTASDSSNSGNNGTLVNGPIWVESGIQYGDDYTWQAEAFGPGGSKISTPNPDPNFDPSIGRTAPICEPPKPGLVLTPVCEVTGPAVLAEWSYAINATSYELRREEGVVDPVIATVSQTSSASLRTETDDNGGLGLLPLTPYSYYVVAKPIGAFPDIVSDTIDVTTLNCTLSTQPQNVTAIFECSPESDGVLGGTTSAEATDPVWTTGQLGGALDFDGIDDYVDMGSSSTLYPESGTVALWVKNDNAGNEGVDRIYYTTGNWTNAGLSIFKYNIDNKVYFQVNAAQGPSFDASSWAAGEWHHVVGTWTAKTNPTMELFIDGVSAGSVVTSLTANGISSTRFGMTTDGTRPFDGLFDEVRIYNRALTGSEIDEVRLNTFTDTRNLIAYWNFDDAAGQIASNNTLRSDPVGQVTWEDSDNATSYTVYRDDGATFGPITDDDSVVYVYDDDTIAVDTAYTYTVQAFGPGGSSPMSGSSNPSIGTGNYCRPYFPTIGSIGSACMGLNPENTITWSDFSTINTTGYNIYRTTTNNVPDNPTDLIATVPVGTSIYLDNSGLSLLTTYYYWVEAVGFGAFGTSLSSAKSVLTLACGVAPDDVTDLTITNNQCVVGVSQIELDWSDTANAISYDVRRTNPDSSVSVYQNRWHPFTDTGSYALDFDGVGDIVTAPHSSSLDITGNQLTVAAWIRPTVSGQGNSSYVVTKSDGNKASLYGIKFRSNNFVEVAVRVGGSETELPSTSALSLDTWYYVTEVYDGLTLKIYINGVEDASTVQTGNIDSLNTQFGIGAHVDKPSDRRFQGQIDDVRVYNRALSDAEIQDLANGLSVSPLGLVGMWNFDDGSGVTVKDDSGNGNTGTFGGDPQWEQLTSADPSHDADSLQGNMSYSYTVRALGVDTESGDSNIVPNPPVPTISCEPEDPNLTVVPDCSTGGSGLKLVWCGDDAASCPNTDYWNIHKKLGGACIPADESFLFNPPQISYIDTNVQSGAIYEYCAEAFGVIPPSVFSLSVPATAPFCANLPYNGTPADINIRVSAQCSGSNSRIVINWDVDSTGDTISYNLLRRPGGGGSFASVASGLSPSTLSHTDTTITPTNDYVYRLEAVGSGPGSTIFMDSPQITALDCVNTPPQPSNLTLNVVVSKGANPQSVSLSWTDASNEYDDPDLINKAGYQLFRDGNLIVSLQGGDLASYSYVDNTVVDNTIYEYQVRAYNSFASYDPSDPDHVAGIAGGTASNKRPVTVPIALPGDFTMDGTPAGGEIQLTWTAAPVTAAGTPVTYKVVRDDSQSFLSPTTVETNGGLFCENLSGLSCVDIAPDFTESWYRVIATNIRGSTNVKEPKQFFITLFPQQWREISPF